tara:strand:+ start:853 stop:1338 length:486 start_codon:yes stop_codon:yes gene_type:complete
MKVLLVIALIGVALIAQMYFAGQLQVVAGSISYVAPPDQDDEIGHVGHQHNYSFCQTALQCAAETAKENQKMIGPREDRPELQSVRAEGAEVIYDYYLPRTKSQFESAIPPPDQWLQGNRDEFCADELNWPMTELGMITVMRFHGIDNVLLGEVRIGTCAM